MSIRKRSEDIEYTILATRAAKARETRGRAKSEDMCDIRTEYQRDRDRIIHSKSFRRLKHKTQVFLSPEGDHYRTRLTHTLEVAQISRTVARALRLNEDLTEAIAMGHDLGHTPFGHCGEYELDAIHKGGFAHNEQSLRVVDYLEERRRGTKGLNLTEEVRDGILNHRGSGMPMTLEGQIVKICDRIAYINHDIDDAVRAHVLTNEIFPKEIISVLGDSHSARINRLIMDLIKNSEDSPVIQFSEDVAIAFLKLREFMFTHVYLNIEAKGEEEKARMIVKTLYEYFIENPDKMPPERFADFSTLGNDAVRDFIAGMSDRYAVSLYQDLFIPKFWR